MRILHVKVLFDGRMISWSGIGRYSKSLIKALSRNDAVDLTVVLNPKDAEVLSGIAVKTVAAVEHPFSPRGGAELANLVRQGSYDILHCAHFPMPNSRVGVPIVVTLHDLIPLEVHSTMPNPIKRMVYRTKNRRAIAMASKIITVSDFSKHDIERTFPAARGRVRVTHLAGDDFVAGPVVLPMITERYFLSMGNTKPHKNLELLVDAFEHVGGENPDIKLIFVGKRKARWLDEVLKAHPSLQGRIEFTGALEDDELRGYYSRAQALLVPSLYEGFGLPVLEAMGLGTPVIASNVTSLPEVVGDAGMLLDPRDSSLWADAMGKLLADGDFSQELVASGLKRSDTFSWQKTAEQTLSVYEQVIAGE